MSIIRQWNIWCVTESLWKIAVTIDDEDAPTKCPTNTAHTIGAVSCTKETDDTVQLVEIKQLSIVDETYVNVIDEGMSITVDTGEVNSVLGPINMPFDIDVIGGTFYYDNILYGDKVVCYSRDVNDTSCGKVTANATTGDYYLFVDNDTLGHLAKAGWYIKIGSESYDYRVSKIEVIGETNRLSLFEPLKENKSIDDDVYVRHYYMNNYMFPGTNRGGFEYIGSIPIHKEKELMFIYQHKTAPEADGEIHINLVYGY